MGSLNPKLSTGGPDFGVACWARKVAFDFGRLAKAKRGSGRRSGGMEVLRCFGAGAVDFFLSSKLLWAVSPPATM